MSSVTLAGNYPVAECKRGRCVGRGRRLAGKPDVPVGGKTESVDRLRRGKDNKRQAAVSVKVSTPFKVILQ